LRAVAHIGLSWLLVWIADDLFALAAGVEGVEKAVDVGRLHFGEPRDCPYAAPPHLLEEFFVLKSASSSKKEPPILTRWGITVIPNFSTVPGGRNALLSVMIRTLLIRARDYSTDKM
jgi:hypothetical protein